FTSRKLQVLSDLPSTSQKRSSCSAAPPRQPEGNLVRQINLEEERIREPLQEMHGIIVTTDLNTIYPTRRPRMAESKQAGDSLKSGRGSAKHDSAYATGIRQR